MSNNVFLSNCQINRLADEINGAAVGYGKMLGEKPYNEEHYIAATKKLVSKIDSFLKAVNIKDKTMRSYMVGEMISRAMRWSKGDVKVLSGSAFRKWFREDLAHDRLQINTAAPAPKEHKEPTKKLVNASEFAQFKAWQAAQSKAK